MKIIRTRSLAPLLFVLALALCPAGCGVSDDQCNAVSGSFIRTSTVQDQNPQNPITVAIFHFSQKFYDPKVDPAQCNLHSEINLKVENFTQKMISFPYRVAVTYNNNQYGFDGVAALNPGATQDQGLVSTLPVRLDLAQIKVTLIDNLQVQQ